jgi:hypothetical protein
VYCRVSGRRIGVDIFLGATQALVFSLAFFSIEHCDLIQIFLSEGLNDLISFPVPQRFANKQHHPYQDRSKQRKENRLDPSSLRQNEPSGEQNQN